MPLRSWSSSTACSAVGADGRNADRSATCRPHGGSDHAALTATSRQGNDAGAGPRLRSPSRQRSLGVPRRCARYRAWAARRTHAPGARVQRLDRHRRTVAVGEQHQRPRAPSVPRPLTRTERDLAAQAQVAWHELRAIQRSALPPTSALSNSRSSACRGCRSACRAIASTMTAGFRARCRAAAVGCARPGSSSARCPRRLECVRGAASGLRTKVSGAAEHQPARRFQGAVEHRDCAASGENRFAGLARARAAHAQLPQVERRAGREQPRRQRAAARARARSRGAVRGGRQRGGVPSVVPRSRRS
mgnify:CR=1 FL=1